MKKDRRKTKEQPAKAPNKRDMLRAGLFSGIEEEKGLIVEPEADA